MNTSPLRMLSLCSGIGGFDLAAERAGIRIVGQVEIDPHCRRVLAQHWPHVPRKADIHEVRGDEFGPIDLLAGGIPCQGNSYAGRRRGRLDDRNLWPEFRRILRATRARWAVVENVRGLLSTNVDQRTGDHGLFGDILRDLADLRYSVGWYVLSAAACGAPHKRERVFLIAHDDLADPRRAGRSGRGARSGLASQRAIRHTRTSDSGELADAACGGNAHQQSRFDAPGPLERAGAGADHGVGPGDTPQGIASQGVVDFLN